MSGEFKLSPEDVTEINRELSEKNVLVNGNKLSSPFTIKAIGSPALILGAIQRTGGFLEELYAYGLVSNVVQESNVTIYKYSGIIE